ncbi:WD40-repeat-containing domain protein [Truncatella angustata]|uniref:ASTRA-associated protein 1 n=1 Tax=Truncatella angustata TaxID=152316 RepID=A0A9P8UZT1_9PEZI|nr:WD40-repeat-containing domain protein [Truncatella angustata]KAH6660996.1 WD40-repeat-containing domain protein [Truncatella angustata]KAH8203708.1 hypothetical protein TruAng_002121 [Truncatella angustata]
MASQLPPATPRSVLRGHHAQVHATAFISGNQRLASGDAEGYVVLWDLTIMRPTAVWRAHTNAILGIASWGTDKVITHGRDHRLNVWRVTEEDETRLSTTLPLDPSSDSRPQPWLLHIIEVNTMNFCSFGSCRATEDESTEEILIAVPNTLASESVDIYRLPSQERLYTIHSSEKGEKSGMVMALALLHLHSSLVLVTAYENGLVTVFQQDLFEKWHLVYRAHSHSQPVLSLDVAPNKEYFLTSGADALLVKHPIPRPINTQKLQEKTEAHEKEEVQTLQPGKGKSLLSAALAGESRRAKILPQPAPEVQTQALKIVNTRHSGQQSLRVRSDGKIFATAGWDSKIRVYSARTMKELAVLKWHQVGCFAVTFANLDFEVNGPAENEPNETNKETVGEKSNAAVPKLVDVTVRQKRIKQAKESHWLAAGSKDGKISLWDIY